MILNEDWIKSQLVYLKQSETVDSWFEKRMTSYWFVNEYPDWYNWSDLMNSTFKESGYDADSLAIEVCVEEHARDATQSEKRNPEISLIGCM